MVSGWTTLKQSKHLSPKLNWHDNHRWRRFYRARYGIKTKIQIQRRINEQEHLFCNSDFRLTNRIWANGWEIKSHWQGLQPFHTNSKLNFCCFWKSWRRNNFRKWNFWLWRHRRNHKHKTIRKELANTKTQNTSFRRKFRS